MHLMVGHNSLFQQENGWLEASISLAISHSFSIKMQFFLLLRLAKLPRLKTRYGSQLLINLSYSFYLCFILHLREEKIVLTVKFIKLRAIWHKRNIDTSESLNALMISIYFYNNIGLKVSVFSRPKKVHRMDVTSLIP